MSSAVADQPDVVITLSALGDSVRAAIVQHLGSRGEVTVNELAALFPISLQAVSKHIKTLEAAGVVSQRRTGRHRPVRLERDRIAVANDWLALRVRQLEERYRRLDDVLADLQGRGPS